MMLLENYAYFIHMKREIILPPLASFVRNKQLF